MPNHCINEIIFRNVDVAAQEAILAKVRNQDGEIDFGVLVPKPLNLWDGGVGSLHEKKFRQTGLDWARENWGTKWNAYGIDEGCKYQSIAQGDDTLTLTFQTAWGPPYPWIAALFNFFQRPIEHNWLDEGESRGHSGTFDYQQYVKGFGGWDEVDADDAMQKHLHKLLWGVEEFPDEPDDEAAA
ncbi:hypothetical protein KUL72_20995 [Bradyrhizobium arachidis]|uniref:DUF1281 family ferredoxin-like fold protein n=1 Tax=Bradyrhizobium arachidis TaxID=858423 RepID=UPI002161E124|nr:hypothetical protein [Bradyrhizobium arachidis]UVO33992.1 hypothetical protein KUL72_20995 [Bradyrhizobium arachidis]